LQIIDMSQVKPTSVELSSFGVYGKVTVGLASQWPRATDSVVGDGLID